MNCDNCGHENIDGARFCASCGVALGAGDEQADWIGKVVGGRFKVNRVLGEGGMGVVYEGEQQMGSNVRRVAIKTLHAHLSKDENVLARFHRECGTVSQLEHPNTIKFYDFGEQDGTLYIAMEFLDGKSLDVVIEDEGSLSPSRTVKVMKQVCGSLDEAHDQGVIHRDLKPENVVVTERLGEKDFVKVLDFGIAARSESADAQKEAKLTQQGMVLGTPPYMSPEQFTGVELDRRSDVYSLGVMAYEMLTGQLPFTANTPWQWATEHMTAQPFPIGERPSGAAVPRPMRDAVMSALEKDPNDRPSSAGEFLKSLEEGLAGVSSPGLSAPTEEMQAAPVFTAPQPAAVPVDTDTESVMSATRPPELPVKKGGNGMMIGIAALLLVGGAGAFFATRGGGDTPEEDPGPESAASGAEAETEKPPETEPAGSGGSGAGSEETTKPAETAEPAEPTKPAETAKPTSPSPPVAPKPPPKPPAPTRPRACTSCASMLQSGQWGAVARDLGKCTSSQQSSCRAQASSIGNSQLSSALSQKNCGKAQRIVSSAGSMGVSLSGALKRKASKCN